MSQKDTGRLIRLLAGRGAAPEGPARAEWQELVSLAIQHDLASWYYARLKKEAVQPDRAAAEQLRERYVASAARSMGLFHEIGRILRALRAADVPVMPLKGACLAEAVYGDVALRPMADVDLLVKPVDMLRAVEILRTLGYDSDQPFDPIAEQRISQHMPLMRRRGAAAVEMHWTIVCPGCESRITAADLEGLWSRARSITVAGVPVLALSPTDLLLHLCIHVSTQHRFDGANLRSFVDMAEVARRYVGEIDWDAFARRATRWRAAKGVHLALLLAGEWTECPCPPAVRSGLNVEPLDNGTMNWVRHKILNGSDLPLRSDFTRLEAGRGLRAKVAALRDAVFTPRTAMARMYPAPASSWSLLAYYPVRAKDLWVRYRRALWRSMRRDRTLIADTINEARLREYLGWR
jgi:hypothetical protein